MVVVGLRATEGRCTSERPPIRCKTVVQRVCCGLQHIAGFRVTNARARHCAGYLLEGGVARALATCARRAAKGLIGPCNTKRQCTSGRSLPFAARPWCGVPGAASRTTGFRVANERARHCTGYLLDCGAARALASHACRAAMVLICPCAKTSHSTSERPPIQCNTVLRLVCRGPPTHSRLSRDKSAGAPQLRWLSLGMRRSTSSCDARAPRRNGYARLVRHRRPLRQREASYSEQVRAATCLLRPRTHSRLPRDKRTGAPLR